MSKNLKGTLILALTAIVWGISFVSQSVSMEHIGPNTFAGIRTLLGCITLLPVIMFRNFSEKKNIEISGQKGCRKDIIIGGIICGVLLCIASTVQTYGMKYTTAGKSGFITAMYMILVPIVSIFMGKKIRPSVIGCVLIAVTGLYFLCIKKGEFSMGYGDLVTLICAVFFTFHILVIDRYSPKVDGVKLSCMQFFVAGTINIIIMFIFEKPVLKDILLCAVPILYSGIMSCGVAYTLQIIGQKYAEPTVASLVMSMESVFAALAGWVILGQGMNGREIFGCLLMFGAITLIQLPPKKKNAEKIYG